MRNSILCTALALAALSCPLTSQAAVTTFGTGCATFEGASSIGWNTLPRLGTDFELTYAGPNHAVDHTQSSSEPWLVIGFTAIGPVEIPPVFALQPPGCMLTASHHIVFKMADRGGAYEDRHSLSIPNNPNLNGVVLLAQWLTVHAQCGFAGCGIVWIASSDTAIATIGV